MKRSIYAYFSILVLTGALLLTCTGKDKGVIIASKNFTENIILAEMMAQVVEAETDIPVERKLNMGSTFILYSAITSNEISMYPDYTGTLYQANLKQTDRLSQEDTYEYVKKEMEKQGIYVLNEFGFNNTYAIGLMKNIADERNLQKISDLANHSDLIPGFDSEFAQRSDGAFAMFDYYGLKFDSEIVQMEIGLKLIALSNGDIDFTDAFSTDSKLLRYQITILEDDKNFFPPYFAVPLINKETDEKYPEVRKALAKLSGIISEPEIMQLNYAVEDDKKNVGEVVREFLKAKKIVQ